MPYNLETNIKIFVGTDTTPVSRVYLGIKKTILKCYDYTIPPLQPINELVRYSSCLLLSSNIFLCGFHFKILTLSRTQNTSSIFHVAEYYTCLLSLSPWRSSP